MSYIFFVVFALFLIWFLKLQWISAIAVVLILCGVNAVRIKYGKHQLRCLLHLNETALYLDMILLAFAKSGKIDEAVREAKEVAGEGPLKEILQKACNHLELTYDESEITKYALEMIEDSYECKRVKQVHEFMMHVEYYGGEYETSLDLLLEDKRRWEQRVRHAIEDRRKEIREVTFSVLASLLICGLMVRLPVMNVNISRHILSQIFSVLVLVLDAIIYLRAKKYLICDWCTLGEVRGSGNSLKLLRSYRRCAQAKGVKYSWLKIKGKLLHRLLEKEIRLCFLQWLIDLVLLMQSENVQVAIEKSATKADLVLLDDINLLREKLLIDPESSEPYYLFLQDFKLAEIPTAMGLIYSVSMGNCANGRARLLQLVGSNYELYASAEQARLKNLSGGLYLLFLAPVFTATVKLLVDMVLFLSMFMQLTFM